MQQIQHDEKLYKCVVMYKVERNIFPLFLQIFVDFLRKYYEDVRFDDMFEIDYEHNIIRDSNYVVVLNEVNLNDERVLKTLSLGNRVKLKMIKKYLEGRKIKEVFEKIDNVFRTWAKYGMLRIEYSFLKNSLAVVFYTTHHGVYKTMRENIKKVRRKFYVDVSIYASTITKEEVEKEFDSVLKEVVEIKLIS